MLSVEPFLSAYDPSDLPGSSIDPLGFDRGYAALAEQILPGLTNAAGRPRYYSVLCAAIAISDGQQKDVAAETPRERYLRRERAVLRFERFWALACALATARGAELDTNGIRGIRDAERLVRRLNERDTLATDGEFRLLARQAQYGLLGIYGNVAERLHFTDHAELALRPSFGEPLAEAFIKETQIPSALRTAVAHGGEVKVSLLASWGKQAHAGGSFGPLESAALRAALLSDPTRKRMAELLLKLPRVDEEEPELTRLQRIEGAIRGDEEQSDLHDALRAIRAYEECFRTCLLAFQRLLWLVSEARSYTLSLKDAASDEVLAQCAESLVRKSADLDAARLGATLPFRLKVDRLSDPARFVHRAIAAESREGFVLAVLQRHRDIQWAKRDQGRQKAPWLELEGTTVKPTLAISQRIDTEPRLPEQMAPHGYRTHAVDAFQLKNVN